MIPFIRKNKASKSFELPGKTLSGGYFYLTLFSVLGFPLLCLGLSAVLVPFSIWQDALGDARVLASLKVTFLTSFSAALINLFFGTLVAWVQVRYRFWGRLFWDMLIDLPLALPTAVTGIVLTALFSSQFWVGSVLEQLGVTINYTPLGITLALVFVGFPFVVRQVEPVLEDLGEEMEQAAQMLGASSFHIFYKIILPNIGPAALAGFTAAFARGLGEYGSVIFISGNLPFKTEVISLLIVSQLEQFNYQKATVLAVVMLILSLILLWVSNRVQLWLSKRYGMELS